MNTMVLELDVRMLPPREKHPVIFMKFDNLKDGELMIIVNDHDPKPLYYQLMAERGNIFEWDYLKDGPDVWRIKITKKGKTIGEIAAEDVRKVKVFMKYGIDFCCGGNKPLKEACTEKGLDVGEVEKALQEIENKKYELNFNNMPLHELTKYIIEKHHRYIKECQDALLGLSEKIAERHGNDHPELLKVNDCLKELIYELNMHLMKEENILFPYIETISINRHAGGGLGMIENPIKAMMHEHDVAGDLIKTIRIQSNQYIAPEDACNSYKALYKLIKEFDDDLMVHIHLENNILFPRAIQMEKAILK